MIPYLAATSWYRAWLDALMSGNGDSVARDIADRICLIRGKGRTRSGVLLPSGEVTELSVPIVGGASAIKRLPPDELVVSGHGNWPHTHYGTLETAYGGTPFFHHIAPELKHILDNSPERPFWELTDGIHNLLCRLLSLPEICGDLKRCAEENPTRMNRIAEDVKKGLPRSSCPLLEAFSFLGQEALFAITSLK